VKFLHANRIRAPLQAGFTLAELAIVLLIISFLLGGMMAMFSSQQDARKWSNTQSQLEAARDAILGFAIANGRLPCPANSTSAGAEVRVVATGVCGAVGIAQDYYGGVVAGVTYGLLPAVTIGYQPVDSQGFAVDDWGNRLRYAISRVTTPSTGTPSANFTYANNMKTNGITYLPNDLVVCGVSPATVTNTVCDANTSITNQKTVVAIIFSTGKNGATGGTGKNEARNLDANALFVSRPPDPATATGGEFDDQMVWISIGTLYSKLIAAGVLP
jgi:prepilin-type N-terminal cleavage/methylation domain-containing protein